MCSCSATTTLMSLRHLLRCFAAMAHPLSAPWRVVSLHTVFELVLRHCHHLYYRLRLIMMYVTKISTNVSLWHAECYWLLKCRVKCGKEAVFALKPDRCCVARAEPEQVSDSCQGAAAAGQEGLRGPGCLLWREPCGPPERWRLLAGCHRLCDSILSSAAGCFGLQEGV